MDIKDVVAIVTGGASGLGEATVRRIVNHGGKAVIIDVQTDRGEQLASELGEQALFIKADVTSETDAEQALKKACKQFGHINVLVNCAGIGIGERTVNKNTPHNLGSFKRVIDINLIGTFNMIRLAATKMQENTQNKFQERGVLINTASVAAFDGQIGQAAYSASKGAIVGMTLPIARDLSSSGIRVMTIAPGLFETPLFARLPDEAKEALGKMTPFPQRLGYPEEYAHFVQSIIENPMLNGETVRLDGAIRMQPR